MARVGFLVLLAGCGRLGFGELEATPPESGVAERAPELCESSSWDTIQFADPDVDLTIAETSSGVIAAWIPLAGGPLYAANIGSSWQVTGDPAGTMIKAGTWGHASITSIDDTLIAAEAQYDLSDLKIDLVQPDLSGTSELTCPIARVISDPPMLHAGTDLVSPVTTDFGLTVLPFSATYSAMPSQLSVPSDTPTGMSATSLGNTAVVVWSTATGCNVEQLMDMATGIGSQVATPCASPQLATDGQTVVLVYESPDGIYISRGDAMQIGPANARLLVPGASAPRIRYDGTRFWISYRESGTLTVGYLSSTGALLIRTTGIAASHDAGRLVLVRGEPWLFAAGPTGLQAGRICIPD